MQGGSSKFEAEMGAFVYDFYVLNTEVGKGELLSD